MKKYPLSWLPYQNSEDSSPEIPKKRQNALLSPYEQETSLNKRIKIPEDQIEDPANKQNEEMPVEEFNLINITSPKEELNEKIDSLIKAIDDREEIIRIQYNKNLNMEEEYKKHEEKLIKEQIKELDIKNKEIDKLKE